MRHEFEDGHILLWWGPKVEVKHGDIIHYFQSLRGIEVEWVERPPEPAESEQSAPNVTTVRFS